MFCLLIFIACVFIASDFYSRQRPFELTFTSILLTPVVAHGLEVVAPASIMPFVILNLISFVLVWSALYVIGVFKENCHDSAIGDFIGLEIFLVFYFLIYFLTGLWAEFYPIGERLRDFALIGAVLDTPGYGIVEEPWLSGYIAKYYLYWYRLAKCFTLFGSLDPALVYREIIAFGFSFFITAVFYCFRVIGRISNVRSLIYAVVLCFGSNLAGILVVYWKPDSWWSVSRVVIGGITEFPGWSLILGDAHPHLLNSGLIPFLAIVLTKVAQSENKVRLAFSFIVILVATIGFEYSANAWEVPIAVMLWLSIFLAAMCRPEGETSIRKGFKFSVKGIYALVVSLLCFIGLYSWSRYVGGSDISIKFLYPGIQTTLLSEFLMHWGMFFSVIILGIIVRCRSYQERAVVCGIIGFGLLVGSTCLFVFFSLLMMGWMAILEWKERKTPSFVNVHLIGLVGAVCLIIPDIIYFDDHFSGQFERLNTIFKFYYSGWFCFGFYALYAYHDQIVPRFKKYRGALCFFEIVLALGSLSFFIQSIPVRSDHRLKIKTEIDGLSVVSANFAGARDVISALRFMPRGVVVEASEGAYDWTAHVATLSMKPSYLGWQNHINFLYGAFNETKKRKIIIDFLYSQASCDERKNIAATEGISYLVYGPLEEKRYGLVDFSCMRELMTKGLYKIYTTDQFLTSAIRRSAWNVAGL